MNGLPFYKAYPRDFLDGTVGMRFELKGTYRLLLDLIYMQGGKLPDDPQYIAGHLGMSVRKWNSLRSELIQIGKIRADLGIISNLRADKELLTLRSYQDKQAENARGSRKNKGLEKPPPKPKQSHTDNRYQITEKKESPPAPRGGREPDDFAEFWHVYPRRVGKGAARKKFEAALKKASAETILAGAKRYAAECVGREDKFIAHPATWLNQERWTDEPERRGNNASREVRNGEEWIDYADAFGGGPVVR